MARSSLPKLLLSASRAGARWLPAAGAASGSLPHRRWPQAGAHVTLAARTKSEIEEAAAAIRARGDKAETLVLDVTDVEVVAARHRGR